ncbi:GYF domain-containing protein [Shewanella sp.]|uniref:DUF4339 domain-containing protein n=1 Tax=Shewanella sp. TaxID=50422 RepID=UPI0035683F45
MKEWYFSHNGEVSGPLGLAESKLFIASNPDCYAWHSSLAQWMPAYHIDEFELDLPPPPPPKAIPKALIAHFVQREQQLNQSLRRVEDTLKTIENSRADLESQIMETKGVTQTLNQEVNTTLRSINEQYEALQKKLAGLKTKQS